MAHASKKRERSGALGTADNDGNDFDLLRGSLRAANPDDNLSALSAKLT